jgi:hypothetical protein
MDSKFIQRLTLAAVLAGGLGLGLAQTATADIRPGAPRTRPAAVRGFNLFAGSVGLPLNANRVYCGLVNRGQQCTDYTNSSVLGGSYWPKGSPDQYMFNGGLQIAGIIPSNAGFSWAGDTVGAFFFDGTGYYAVGSGITNIFDSRNADDIANWPAAAYVNDPTLYNASLLGRKSISEQDTWNRYWDGNTNYVLGRPHPMGLLVDQRTLAWNFPTGNQDIIYFITRYINITSTRDADYAGLSAYGYSATDIADIVQIARDYKAAILGKFGVTLPDSGYSFTRVYAGPASDPDVGSGGGGNYSTANLPFKMDFAYIAAFLAPTWQYPPDIFSPPFAVAPGFVGTKFLKGAADPAGNQLPVSMFTNTTNGGAFTDRSNVAAMWRLAANALTPTDGSCNAPVNTPMCQLVQGSADTRMYMYSGPLDIGPGQSQVVVTAHVYAAAVAAAILTDYATPTPHSFGSPLFDLKPGTPGTVDGLISATSRVGQLALDTIRQIDRATGWAVTAANPGNSAVALDISGDGILDQSEIPVIPSSLLAKANVAQLIFDNAFLLPFAPESPEFFLIPSDGQVTVVWRASPTETLGDPYYDVAANPATALYDPNYRSNDVEGYRVWRGRTQSNMALLAQFDYAGTVMTDFTGKFTNSDYGAQCAPEIAVTTSCPSFPHRVELVGDVVQALKRDQSGLGTRDVIPVVMDTAVTGGNSGYPALRDTGVPFVFVDHTVMNGFRYFYAVTAFDVNSVSATGAGETSKNSGLVSKDVTPRVASGQEVAGTLGAAVLLGGDGSTLVPTAALPTINATTGIFSGPMPPTDVFGLGLAAFIPEVLQNGNVTVTIDSVVPGSTLTGLRNTVYWFTGQGAGAAVKFSIPILSGSGAGEVADTASAVFSATAMSAVTAARFGGDATYSLYGQASVVVGGAWGLTMKGRGDANAHPAGPNNGPRWWAGTANENTDDPNGINCYVCALADLSRNAGAIAGVGIFDIKSYRTIGTTAPPRDIEGITSTVMRAADFKWYWGAAGAVDSVVDVTHHVRVPFSPAIRASWGILNDSSFVATTAASTQDGRNNVLTWTDYACVAPVPAYLNRCGGAAQTPAALMDHARLSPVAFLSSAWAGAAGLAATGNGFILYLNGSFFVMQMAALPEAGTVWNARFYAGNVTGTVGSYGFEAATRPPAVPGLRMRISFTASAFDPSVTTDSSLALVHTVPDPYYVTNSLELTANTKVLRFVNLPAQAIVRIYSVSGILVNVLTYNDPGAGGELVWNLRNRNNQFVASGVYFYHVETPDGRTKIGRFTVVNYAQ